MTDAIMALDAGTSSVKVLLVSLTDGAVLARASAPLGLTTPRPGWVEQDPIELVTAIGLAASAAREQRPDVSIAGIAISNQRESVVAWDAGSGTPLGPMVSWQDARMSSYVAGLGDDLRRLVRKRTGLTLDAMYSAPKMRWLLGQDGRPGVRLGTVDSWLLQGLTGAWSIETGNASRTLLLDLATGDWDAELLDEFGIPRAALPEVRPSNAGFGVTKGAPGLPDGIPVIAVLADSHAALFAHAAGDPSTAKATYGTGTSVMAPIRVLSEAPSGIDTTIAWWTDSATYAREGNILSTGQAIDWVARLLSGDASPASDQGPHGGEVVSGLASEVPDAGGVVLVPAFTGLGAPHWDREATALLTGMTATTSRAHVARAALDCVAHQVADLVDVMTSDGNLIVDELRADGGASASDLLMSIQADALGAPVVRSRESSLSALGAAHLAALTLGVALPPVPSDAAITPTRPIEDRSSQRRAWHRALARSRFTAPNPQED